MNRTLDMHPTEDELDEHMMGLGSAETASHVNACAVCRAQVDAFAAPMSSFNQASLAWSEARSNGLSRDIAAHRGGLRGSLRAGFRLGPAGLRYAAATVVLAALFSLSSNARHGSASLSAASDGSSARVAETTGEGSVEAHSRMHNPAEIASDDAMLATIDSEIAAPPASGMELLEQTSTHGARVSASEQAKD